YEIMKKYYYKDISWDEFQEVATSAFAGSLDNFSGIVKVDGGDTQSGTYGLSVSSTIYNEHVISFVEPNSSAQKTVGIKCDVVNGGIVIDENFDPSAPNQQVYIEEGDTIYGVIIYDGEGKGYLYRVENASTSYLRQLLSENQSAVLIIKKYDSNYYDSNRSDAYYAFSLEKQVSDGKTAFYYNYTGDVGIIKVLEFSENTTIDFAQCVLKFIDDGNKKLILDLRNNGGGNSTTLEYMAQFLLNNPQNKQLPLIKLVSNAGNGKKESNLVYSSREDNANPNNPYEAFPIGNRVKGFEVVVLCNGNSASASEALIGALQYYNNAKIVGTQTYGKGVAQKVFVLSNGDYLYVTNGTYYVPTADDNGKMVWEKCIHGEGFTPLAENTVTDRLVAYSKDACTKRAMEILGY
ncbi:MAG: S41 family peptidase, partial [Clostridia bacterium]|nr:S41 family peptidase [Clostridia bacterium]